MHVTRLFSEGNLKFDNTALYELVLLENVPYVAGGLSVAMGWETLSNLEHYGESVHITHELLQTPVT